MNNKYHLNFTRLIAFTIILLYVKVNATPKRLYTYDTATTCTTKEGKQGHTYTCSKRYVQDVCKKDTQTPCEVTSVIGS
jgi:hypothetical protein